MNVEQIEVALKAIDHEMKELKTTVTFIEQWISMIKNEIKNHKEEKQ